jgi:HEAT repeat protein
MSESSGSHSDDISKVDSMLINGILGNLTKRQIDRMNLYPSCEVARLLLERFRTSKDIGVQSRAFSGLMNLNGFDQLQFLKEELATSEDVDWRIASVRGLAELHDTQVVPILCTVLRSDDDADVRFVAAEALGKIGDASALPVLEYAAEHDTGEDYEGWPIADEARKAIQMIREREKQARNRG